MTPIIPSSTALVLLLASLLLDEGDAEWMEAAKLIDQDGEKEDRFGFSVEIDSGILVVGAPYDDDINGVASVGSATIFERVDGAWSAAAKLVASDGEEMDQFGTSVATSDGTVAVGAPRKDNGGEDAGTVYLYVKTAAGLWTEQAKLLPSDIAPTDGLGTSLAMQGSTLVVGSSGSPGAVYVYTFAAEVWTEFAKLVANDARQNGSFGAAVAIRGELLLIGASSPDDELGSYSGSAYVYQLEGGLWSEQAQLKPSDGRSFDFFGNALDVEGDTVCVGSNNNVVGGDRVGAVYVFGRESGSWTAEAKLVASDFTRFGFFGSSLVLQKGVLLVGAPGPFTTSIRTDAAYVFTSLEGAFSEHTKLTASDGDPGDRFGWNVGLDDGVAVIGASNDNLREGSVYAFEGIASGSPSIMPSVVPSLRPITNPSAFPTAMPTDGPTQVLSAQPTNDPTISPSDLPTLSSSTFPSASLSSNPSVFPTTMPSEGPSKLPSVQPSANPSAAPSGSPSFSPSWAPVEEPTSTPSALPTTSPSLDPSIAPSVQPSALPTAVPSNFPSFSPSRVPSGEPTTKSSVMVTSTPTSNPFPGPKCTEVVVDFEEFKAGDTPSDLGHGISVRGDGNRARSGVMVLDTATRTAETDDLASTNLGKILILPADRGSVNSNPLGGFIRFLFDPPATYVSTLDLKDFATNGSSITGEYADGSDIPRILLEPSEDGVEQTVEIGEYSVSRLRINLAGEGGIDNLELMYCETA